MSLVSGTAAQIKAVIEGVTNPGVVLDYDPFPGSEWNDFVALFTSTIGGNVVVRAWTIKNVGRRTVPQTIAMGSEVQRVELDWLVKGFAAVTENDSTSDVMFRDLLEAVTEALNTNRHLAGAPEILDHDPADYLLPGNGALVSLGDTICHYGEVTFTSYHEHVIAVS